MKALRRLYKYLGRYRGWALLAFGSMIVFAVTQTVMVGLIQPVVDEVLSPPGKVAVAAKHESREEKAKERVLDTVLHRDKPEGQRGWLIDRGDAAAKRVNRWWNGDPANKWRKVL